MKPRPRTSRGEVSVESVIYFPAILLIILCGFHLAALMHTTHVGSLAASRGAYIAATQFETFGNISMAVDEINTVTSELGGRRQRQPTISVSEKLVTVSVFVESPQIVPFLPTTVIRTASSSREAFLQEQDR